MLNVFIYKAKKSAGLWIFCGLCYCGLQICDIGYILYYNIFLEKGKILEKIRLLYVEKLKRIEIFVGMLKSIQNWQ